MTSASTRPFAVLGDPVGHSLSPVMHNAAFRVLGIDAVYLALRVPAADVAATIRLLVLQGGGGNVTVPHKAEAARAVHGTPRVQALEACNTFWGEGGEAKGENTDVDGVLAAWRALGAPAGGWLVLGTGGSARAVVAAAVEAGVPVALRSRSPARAGALRAWADALGAARAEDDACGVAINCTPLGLQPSDALPLDPVRAPAAVRAALDLVYAKGETAWVRAMRAAGRTSADGREMLLMQGAAAFRRWFPRKTPPVDAMRAALRDALG